MIIVNTAGDWTHVYGPLRHAQWHGCTPTDLVFPSFMYIIGVSMWFSFAKYGRQWSPSVGKKILKRTLVLFAIGLLLNKFPVFWKDLDTWRIMGVPQRLALGYGLGAVLALTLQRRTLLWVCGGLLLLYWAVLWGYGVQGGHPYSLPDNAVRRLDLWLLGASHLYHGDGIAFDPEGVLSTLPSVVTVLLGWLSGELMSYRERQPSVLVRDLLAYGALCAAIGLAWGLFFPINKKLWTSSYVLYAGGLSMILLAFSVWLIDMRRWRNGAAFFFAFGANALFAYVLSEALVISWYNLPCTAPDGQATHWQACIYNTFFRPLEGAEFSSFLFALAYMLLCWAVCRWLYVRKVFIKI